MSGLASGRLGFAQAERKAGGSSAIGAERLALRAQIMAGMDSQLGFGTGRERWAAAGTPGAAAGPATQVLATAACRDEQFIDMLKGYRASGGIARCSELERLVRGPAEPAGRCVERWLGDAAVFAFQWQSTTWIPWFQLTGAPPTPHAGLRPILEGLGPRSDDWELALWFSRPNPLLEDACPATVLHRDAAAVHRAAQAWRAS